MSTRISSLCFEEGGGKRPNVARCLFGKPDRDTLSIAMDLQEEILQAQDAKRFSERWGFNPVTGLPVEGSPYVCTQVEKSDSIPEFYTKGYAPRRSKHVVRSPRDSWRGPYNQSLFASDSRRNVKRRLQLDLDDDQENKQISSIAKVYICERKVSPTSSSDHHLRPIALPSSSSSVTALSCSPVQPFHRGSPRVLCSHTTTACPPIISPSSIRRRSKCNAAVVPSPFLDLATPRSLEVLQTPQRQTLMKEYFPLQKSRRSTSTKSLLEV